MMKSKRAVLLHCDERQHDLLKVNAMNKIIAAAALLMVFLLSTPASGSMDEGTYADKALARSQNAFCVYHTI